MNRGSKRSMNANGPKSSVSPNTDMLSLFSTPCTNPNACHAAAVCAVAATVSRSIASAGGRDFLSSLVASSSSTSVASRAAGMWCLRT